MLKQVLNKQQQQQNAKQKTETCKEKKIQKDIFIFFENFYF